MQDQIFPIKLTPSKMIKDIRTAWDRKDVAVFHRLLGCMYVYPETDVTCIIGVCFSKEERKAIQFCYIHSNTKSLIGLACGGYITGLSDKELDDFRELQMKHDRAVSVAAQEDSLGQYLKGTGINSSLEGVAWDWNTDIEAYIQELEAKYGN